MKALKVFEAYNFQRGIEPKRSLQIGKNQSLLYRALTDPDNEINGDGFYQWMSENPTLAKALKFDTDPLPLENYLTFDLDWYCEEKGVDREDLMNEFIRIHNEIYVMKKSGEVRPMLGLIKNIPGARVLFYQGGNIDGFITRKDWIGLDK